MLRRGGEGKGEERRKGKEKGGQGDHRCLDGNGLWVMQ